MEETLFNDLIASVKEAVAISKGDQKAARITPINEEGNLNVQKDVFLSKDIHDAVFETPPTPKPIEQMDEGIKSRMQKYARKNES